jgi:ferredoxin, 2Fe-2S
MKIKVLPQNIELENHPDQSLLEQCLNHGIKIRSVCKGIPSCAECRVTIQEGISNLLPPTQGELNLIGNHYFLDNRRLACQCRAFGPVTLDVSDHLNLKDESTKKVRGIPQDKLKESQSVLRTLVLDDEDSSPSSSSSSSGSRT